MSSGKTSRVCKIARRHSIPSSRNRNRNRTKTTGAELREQGYDPAVKKCSFASPLVTAARLTPIAHASSAFDP